MSGKRILHVPDMALHRDELEEVAQERFAFLTSDKGLGPCSSQREVQSTSYYYVDPRAPIGIEIHLDFRDETVRMYLLRLRDSALPPHGFVDVEKGERIRVSFLSLLKDILRVEDGRLDEMSDLLDTAPSSAQPRDHRWADTAVARWRDVVERHIDMVARQPLEALFPHPPPGASSASQA